jgi:hypothetical protein
LQEKNINDIEESKVFAKLFISMSLNEDSLEEKKIFIYIREFR